MIEFAKAFLLWLGVFAPSAGVASFMANRERKVAPLGMQATLFLLSALLIQLTGTGIRPGWSARCSFVAFVAGFCLSLVLNSIQEGETPDFLPEGPMGIVLLLLIAPLSEELLNRGLVEGYLLGYGNLLSAILFSALLFALPHWMAFEGDPMDRTVAVAGAFTLGILTGYLFAISGFVPAFIAHSSANLAGLTLKLRETRGYK
ncbi:CPBP family intramembrane glutamic endopeptidase [Thermococcus sp.]